MAVQRLTAAYRSRPRPSSTPGAKASTVNSYYLDGERPTHISVWIVIKYPQDPRRANPAKFTYVNSVYWPCAVFKVHRGAHAGSLRVVSQN
jgi:hypothetical protein